MFEKEYRDVFSKVRASERTYERIMDMTSQKTKRPRILPKVLIAAAIISLLAVTASAAEMSWFTKFFGGAEKLDQEQVQYIEEKTQKIEAEPATHREPKQEGHTDVLQFVWEQTIILADNNNTDMTGEGNPNYHDVKMVSLTLSPTQAKLKYYYYEDMDHSKPCSLPNLAVQMKSGETVIMPISASQNTLMTFTAEEELDLYEVENIRLPDGTVLEPINEVDDGYKVSLDSVMTDGTVAYITLNVTVPKEIPPIGEGWTMDRLPVPSRAWICPGSQEKATMEQIVWQRGVGGGRLEDDGDGNPNTFKYVSSVTFLDGSHTFEPGSEWRLYYDGFRATWHNAENQAKIDEKYAGQDYLIDGEEAESTVQFRDMCWDTWEFTFTFEGEEAVVETVEFVQEPILLAGKRLTSIDELLAGLGEYIPIEAKLVSFKVSPLSYYIEYAYEDGTNAGNFIPGGKEMYTLVMNDGRQYELFYAQGQNGFEEPIILANIDHLLLPTGERLDIPQ